ncbi:iron-sulfur cluster repair di-iron protein [Mycolicibacter sinensis]|uniref:Iron-sulfur cluster repair di-iron protein n=1 Tax=Mycolicibacter sinensis (strain JDM601) TaxID=875328 RepID=A0A1A2Y7X4_MYCSD|nr:iron-sulfur cluster repair di-iron protein [Mycolicibacter sinensis]OBH20259.1 iron-sulfur cluster repair di-iron protein [Mycolicibacter sinensis]OBI33181.1 iron-sulfur cluster repair di-iron protein [Mycolicibacter sinensis]
MAAFTSDQILGDIVTADPSTTRILSRFGIDFCCHGQRTLGDACAADGVDAQELLAALNSSTAPAQRADWAGFDDPALIAHIVSTHHRFLWDEFPRLAELVDKVARVHGRNHGELVRVRELFHQLRAGMEPHLRTEETMLFPEISLRAGRPDRPLSDELRNELAANQREHDNAGRLLAELRELTDGYTIPADACASYTAMLSGLADLESDIHLHVHKENNVLFPRVLATAATA